MHYEAMYQNSLLGYTYKNIIFDGNLMPLSLFCISTPYVDIFFHNSPHKHNYKRDTHTIRRYPMQFF